MVSTAEPPDVNDGLVAPEADDPYVEFFSLQEPASLQGKLVLLNDVQLAELCDKTTRVHGKEYVYFLTHTPQSYAFDTTGMEQTSFALAYAASNTSVAPLLCAIKQEMRKREDIKNPRSGFKKAIDLIFGL
jgi:hypothetical protein